MSALEEGPNVFTKTEGSDHVERTDSKADTVQYAVTNDEQSRLRRAFDRRMLPVVCILYVLSYLDRGNIGNAKTAGAQKDLGLSSSQWTWVLNGFYICYVLFEWTVLLWKIFPAHIYVAVLCLGWGIMAMCAGAVQNMPGMVVVRCILGIFEASFGAGAPYYLSLFYQRRELAKRVSLLLGMSPLANCFAGAMAYGITQIKHGIEPWRWLFIIDGPGQAKFLSTNEQTLAVERMQTKDRTSKNKIHWSQFFAGLRDYPNVVHTLIHFMCNYSFAGLSNFLPTIIKDMGYSSINAQGLTAPVYFASFLLCVLGAVVSDKYGKRGFIVAVSAAVGCIGYLLLAVIQDEAKTGARYCGVWLAVCGIFPALCINITWLLNNNGGDSKRGAGLAILATFGQCSSFLSSAVFPSSDAPYYVKGCAIGCGFTGSIVILSLGLVVALHAENKKKDRLHGPVDESVQYDISAQGDKHPMFRYLL
ncbi:hypothetical protein LTR10_015588 [Elasticomyces elasticus]|uniref:Major facilitator superfamily (MFS) profile domain-containing protein n=1 Tax=Exophiala sideris TaxID=1016849 RepID=A0ABR0JL41_9EURO|nr:hypothetical protein LTR10_015588 [Elasticomyces elasticus]KAK5032300.1 hypothetical protein LTR13_007518 [Exophiala sideris]KAK5036298.1 hypothetical protein LTS07_002024 [Exophiala sideris]KAK5066681.1 hypothetical protein LTR69_002028 [Exophiala sideris]